MRLTRSRTGTAMSALGHGGKKLFGEHKGSLNSGRPVTAASAASAVSSVGGRAGRGGGITAVGISAPIPMSMPAEMAMPMGLENGYASVMGAGKMGILHASQPLHSSPPPMIISTRNLDVESAPFPPPIQPEETGGSDTRVDSAETEGERDQRVYHAEEEQRVDTAERDKSRSVDIGLGAVGVGLVTITDSEREGATTKQTRRKSRRMSAPLVALGATIANFANVGSGTDTEATAGGLGVRRKRVSKVMIGSPEGFKHEGHVGMGGAMTMMTRPGTGTGFLSSPEVPESWNVEAWRAEIERTLSVSHTLIGLWCDCRTDDFGLVWMHSLPLLLQHSPVQGVLDRHPGPPRLHQMQRLHSQMLGDPSAPPTPTRPPTQTTRLPTRLAWAPTRTTYLRGIGVGGVWTVLFKGDRLTGMQVNAGRMKGMVVNADLMMEMPKDDRMKDTVNAGLMRDMEGLVEP